MLGNNSSKRNYVVVKLILKHKLVYKLLGKNFVATEEIPA